MKKVIYPAIFHKTGDKITFFVEIPDLDKATQGKTIEEAIEMAREIICIEALEREKNGEALPAPTEINAIETDDNAIVSLVDADVTAYKRRMENRCTRKNCTIPIWLNDEAEKANINFSDALRAGLKNMLGIDN